jgi:hypothetical protein
MLLDCGCVVDADELYSSPSVAVGLETPPESQRATPVHNVLARRDSLTLKSGQTIVPTVELRRSTAGYARRLFFLGILYVYFSAEDLRHRRPSFGQRMNSLLRPRGKTESHVTGERSPTQRKTASPDNSIPAVTAEEEEVDVSETPEEVVGTEMARHSRQLSIV